MGPPFPPSGVQRQSRARVVGISQEFDLAVLYVDLPPEYLDPAELGQPAALRVGQSCYVIGKQAGQGHTLTFGVISGLNRRVVAMNGAMIRRAIQARRAAPRRVLTCTRASLVVTGFICS